MASWQEGFITRMENDGPWGNWELFKLAVEVENHTVIPDFEGLHAPKHLSQLTPLPHQLEAAKQVVEEYEWKSHFS